jgi:hypothetical protein
MVLRIAALLVTAAVAARAAQPVPLWGRWDLELHAAAAADPKTEVTVDLRSPSDRTFAVEGFWDGGSIWRARFMPVEPGTWSYRTRSVPPVAGLDGVSGRFECRRAPHKGNPLLRHGPVRVASSGTHLVHADGTPFFWLGDTVWNGVLQSSREDWSVFLADRAAKRFSVIQFVMTAPWRTSAASAEGEVAFTGRDDIAISPRFFARIDERVDAINAAGLVAVPVLLWAIRGDENPGYSLPESQAIQLARYLVARYGAHHIVWIPAGDGNYSGDFAERWKRIGRAVFGDAAHAPTVMHPGGMQWPYAAFRDEKWLDLIGYQSGHGDDAAALRWIHSGPAAQSWRDLPVRPMLNLEPPYEDHLAYQSRQPHSATNVRRAAYWSLLATPIAGLTYGAHGVWSWQTTAGVPAKHERTGVARPWREAMALEGSGQMKHLARLFGSLRWWEVRPDSTWLEAPESSDPARHVSAACTPDGAAAVAYLPAGGDVRVRARFRDAGWFDPRTGARSTASGAGGALRAPDDRDWVLVVRGIEKAKPAP